MAHFASIGFGATMLPEILWSQVQDQAAPKITLEMAKGALTLTGLEFTDDDAKDRPGARIGQRQESQRDARGMPQTILKN